MKAEVRFSFDVDRDSGEPIELLFTKGMEQLIDALQSGDLTAEIYQDNEIIGAAGVGNQNLIRKLGTASRMRLSRRASKIPSYT